MGFGGCEDGCAIGKVDLEVALGLGYVYVDQVVKVRMAEVVLRHDRVLTRPFLIEFFPVDRKNRLIIVSWVNVDRRSLFPTDTWLVWTSEPLKTTFRWQLM